MRFRSCLWCFGWFMLAASVIDGCFCCIALGLKWALFSGEDITPFLITCLLGSVLSGLSLFLGKGCRDEGRIPLLLDRGEVVFVIVAVWLSWTLMGGIPFLLSGVSTSIADAFFESCSALTTTGCTCWAIPLDQAPPLTVLWKSVLAWLGGCSTILLFLFFPLLRISTQSVLSQDPPLGERLRFMPCLKEYSFPVLKMYVLLTFVAILVFLGAGTSFFHAVYLSFTSISTSGFSVPQEESLRSVPFVREWVALFCIIGALNFRQMRTGFRWNGVFLNHPEFLVWLGVLLLGTLVMWMDLASLSLQQFGDSSRWKSLRQALLCSVTSSTTSGLSFLFEGPWTDTLKWIASIQSFVGGMMGSTSGGLKVGRAYALLSLCCFRIRAFIVPHQTDIFSMRGCSVSRTTMQDVFVLLCCMLGSLVLGWGLFTMHGWRGDVSFLVAFECVTNTGNLPPEIDLSRLSEADKWISAFLMIVGRFECVMILSLFSPVFWRKTLE